MPDFKKFLLSFTNCLSSLLLWFKRPSGNEPSGNEPSPSPRPSNSPRPSHRPSPGRDVHNDNGNGNYNRNSNRYSYRYSYDDNATDAMSTRRKRTTATASAASRRSGPVVATLPKDELAAFETTCLKVHNKYRALHGCPPLKLTHELNVLASDWAQTLAKRNKMDHRPNNDDYGENIYYSEGMDVDAVAAVKMWYDEIDMYNFNAAKFTHGTGHFTQLIWRDTKELGVGVATKGNKVWVVSNYAPPGNWEGEFRENVPRKKA